jgi:hypothetical protein
VNIDGLKAGHVSDSGRLVVMLTAHVCGYAVFDVARAPAGVEQFPLAMVYLDRIPGVAVWFERRQRACAVVVITSTLSMSTDNNCL